MTTAAESASELDQSDEGNSTKESRRPKATQARGTADEPGFGYTLRMAFIIATREIRALFDSLIGYVVIGGTSLALGVYFFLMPAGGFWQVNRASLGRLYDFMPWALSAIVIPLVTMRALAEEKRSGTLELLITMPVRDSSVILGKFFAAFAMCLLLLLATLLYPIVLFYGYHVGPIDSGTIWSGYLGLALFAAAGTAVGMYFSSITESQIIAFFLTMGTLVSLQILGLIVDSIQGQTIVADVASFLSFQSRFAPFGRGLIDTRAVVYFLSITVIALLASFRQLESRKWS